MVKKIALALFAVLHADRSSERAHCPTPQCWSAADVESYLHSLGYTGAAEAVRHDGIDGKTLARLELELPSATEQGTLLHKEQAPKMSVRALTRAQANRSWTDARTVASVPRHTVHTHTFDCIGHTWGPKVPFATTVCSELSLWPSFKLRLNWSEPQVSFDVAGGPPPIRVSALSPAPGALEAFCSQYSRALGIAFDHCVTVLMEHAKSSCAMQASAADADTALARCAMLGLGADEEPRPELAAFQVQVPHLVACLLLLQKKTRVIEI